MKEKLKELREKRGLSQAEVAQEIGISRQMYNKYERGDTEPSLCVIKSLCKMYAVSYNDLLGSVSAEKQLYDVKDLSSDHLMISSPSVGYDLSGVTVSSFGTENYYAKIISLLPNLLLSEKSRLLTAIAQSMTDEVEVHVKGMKSQSLKVNQNDIIFPSEEEYNNSLKEFIQYATAKHFSSNGQKWTREDMHER